MEKIYCPRCNRQLEENELFCSKCGMKKEKIFSDLNKRKHSITAKCPNCSTIFPRRKPKCPNCGIWVRNKWVYIFEVLFWISTLLYCLILSIVTLNIVTGISYVCISLLIYKIAMIPPYVAEKRNHPDTTKIFCLNVFFGFTIVGWIAALIWALKE